MEVILMTTEPERALDARLFATILESGPRDQAPGASGRVCQACGRTGYVRDRDELDAAHAENGNFLGFSPGHRLCDLAEFSVRSRAWRHCEVCRCRTPATESNRVGLLWVCRGCRARIDGAELLPGAVLGDLGRRRWEARGRFPVPPDLDRDELPRSDEGFTVPPPPGWLPRGLYACDGCGEIAGITKRASGSEVIDFKSTCLCEGLICRACGCRLIRRPVRDHFDPRAGHWWHTPHFRAFDLRCWDCIADQRPKRSGR